MKTIQQGFTLIELMIVVAIVAVLAAIAISQYQDYVIRTQVSEGAGLSDDLKNSVAEFYQSHGSFPKNNTSAGVALATSITGSYVSSVSTTANTGVVFATFGGPRVNAKLTNSYTLKLSPITHAGSIEWHCKSDTLPQKWCASSCVCTG